MRLSFPPALRIRTEEQIKRVLKKGQRISNGEFTLIFCTNELVHARLGVIASKKNIRHAHQRNLFKRIMREYFRLHQHEVKGVDIIVLANKKAEVLARRELQQCIAQQWQKLTNSLKKLG